MGRGSAAASALACLVLLGAAAPAQKDGFKRYKDDGDQKQGALEGKTAPGIVATEWLNSKPLKLGSLKGKVVLLDFWAFW